MSESVSPAPTDGPDLSDSPDLSDGAEPATVTPYRDGPLIVRGNFRIIGPDGDEIDPGRRTVALCRCGKSGVKPFCDGSHSRAGFRAPAAPSRPRPTAGLDVTPAPTQPDANPGR